MLLQLEIVFHSKRLLCLIVLLVIPLKRKELLQIIVLNIPVSFTQGSECLSRKFV